MTITFTKTGFLTTLQDLGRTGYRRFGINPNGVMDRAATRLINILLGNDENETVVEMHFPAPRILFSENAVMAIGGADFEPTLNGRAIKNWTPVFVDAGSELDFQKRVAGNRAYLSVCGGFNNTKWLGSSSTNLAAQIGGLDGRTIQTGDKLELNKKALLPAVSGSMSVSSSLLPSYSRFPTVRAVPGAEFGLLSDDGKRALFASDFVVSANSDRMGFRLQGEPINLSRPHEIVSAAAAFGTIQLLPDGQMIVLMADHQTSGGYPRIAHVASRDLSVLAQVSARDKVSFHRIEHSEAERLALEFEEELSFFRVGCRFQTRSWL